MNGRFKVNENSNPDQAQPGFMSEGMHSGSLGLQAEWMDLQDKRCSFVQIAESEREPQPEPEGRKEWLRWHYRNNKPGQPGETKPA